MKNHDPPDLLYVYCQNVKSHQYHNREMFLTDVDLILKNSIQYNGEKHTFTETARKMSTEARKAIEEVRPGIRDLVLLLMRWRYRSLVPIHCNILIN